MIVVRRLSMLLASTSLLAACAATPPPQAAVAPIAVEAPAVAAPAEPVPVPALVEEVAIPHQSFQLANGLTVLVHEDHKAPVVAVSTWYNVGSKDEPAGKTGFAHLFEHLMFNGSENAPKDFYNYLQQIGATDYNGTHLVRPHQLFRDRPQGRRSSGRCSWNPTAWAICLERSPRRSSITSAASSRTRSARATTSRAGWSNMCSSRICSPRAIRIATRRSDRWPISTPPAWPTSSNGSSINMAPTMP